LSKVTIEDGIFTFSLKIPLSVGVVGGMTTLHPLSALSYKIMNVKIARKLMSVACSVGLAQNFAAVRSLITTGIQEGHMRLHLSNILQNVTMSDSVRGRVTEYFSGKTISYSEVLSIIEKIKEEESKENSSKQR
ncbi:hydroxymethylglutaryl-CoA reductase, partial [Bacteriovoracaceae bacterium]|nr:hydroxymethylglutaryl-CoA reductase [Bacteriovoracaceae bacterium]